MKPAAAQRGHVYRAVIQPEATMLCLVVTNNAHNMRDEFATSALITADRDVPDLPDWVRLNAGDPAFGHIVCSHIGPMHRSELVEDLGEVSMETMLAVNSALKRLLGL